MFKTVTAWSHLEINMSVVEVKSTSMKKGAKIALMIAVTSVLALLAAVPLFWPVNPKSIEVNDVRVKVIVTGVNFEESTEDNSEQEDETEEEPADEEESEEESTKGES